MHSGWGWVAVFVWFVGACASDVKSPEPQPAAADGGSDAALATRVPIRPGGDAACMLASVTEMLTAGETFTDCGQLTIKESDADLAAAQKCAEAARDGQRAFRLLWAVQGIDSGVQYGLLGRHGDAGYVIERFEWDSSGFENDVRTAWWSCPELSFTTCTTAQERLCTTCDVLAAPMCSCKVTADSASWSIGCP